MKIIWFDVTNTPQVHFQVSIAEALKENYQFFFTSRDFAETNHLLKQKLDKDHLSIGGHVGKNKIRKILNMLSRTLTLYSHNFKFNLSISNGSDSAIFCSKLKGRKAITFGDNDTAPHWIHGKFIDFAFFPDAISSKYIESQYIDSSRYYRYNGYKEDIYIANYSPDKDFLKSIPFENYVLVRPENTMANYIRNGNVNSITPILLKRLSESNYNILFLPRYNSDKNYANGINNIYIPDNPLNGLDACYYSSVVITGAGTLAREAACLGVPAISFYAGKTLLAVDKKMIKDDWMFFSRDSEKIIDYIQTKKRRNPSLERSKQVKKEVLDKLKEVIENL